LVTPAQVPPPTWFAPTLAALLDRRDLNGMQMCEVMHGLLSGACGDVETAALLVALGMKGETAGELAVAAMHGLLSGACGDVETAALLVALGMKGETAGELAAAAAVMREYMVRLDLDRTDVLDTCGTGGDGSSTFNISTATALVVAAAGVPVVKHGNRAVSSTCGSADVLAALDVPVHADPVLVRGDLERTGMAFCLAPHFHPALRHLGPVRSRLGFRTLFNCLGPLANPAGARFQLLGVGREDWLDRMAGALARLQFGHAFVVCGGDGLDEVSLSEITLVREVKDGNVTALQWTPEHFGLPACSPDALRVRDAHESAAVIRSVLSGQDGAPLHVVLANAAAALLLADKVATLVDGVTLARTAVESGRAARVLAGLVTSSRTE
jgi:anthranilate phosphoribosyltransferase